MCIKHEDKGHQVITLLVIIGDKDQEAIKSNTELLVVKPIAEDQSKSVKVKECIFFLINKYFIEKKGNKYNGDIQSRKRS